MLRAYFNYPNSRVSVHGCNVCGQIRTMGKAGQRTVHINPGTLGAAINGFLNRADRFASEAALNDMWVEVDFNDAEFELAILNYIHRLVAANYTPFRNAIMERHCS